MKRVRVYYNLHKKCLSVLCKQENGWRLWLYANEISLLNVNFKVSEAGRQRVLREKKRNVHTFVEGDWSCLSSWSVFATKQVSYNPYKGASFVLKDCGTEIKNCRFATIQGKKILAEV